MTGASVLLTGADDAGSIRHQLEAVRRALAPLSDDYEVVLTLDGSSEATRLAVQTATAPDPHVKVVGYPSPRGKGWAWRRGFQACTGDPVLMLDSDLEPDTAQIEALCQTQSESGADIVIASKRHEQSTQRYPPNRALFSRVYFGLVRILLGLTVRDIHTGQRLVRREAMNAVMPRLLIKEFAFGLEILACARRLGFTFAEAPVVADYPPLGRIRPAVLGLALVDTLAVFYRDRILRYYDRPRKPDTAAQPPVSVIIPCRDEDPYLHECLKHVAELDYPDYDVLLLPDAPFATNVADDRVRVCPTGPISPPAKRDFGLTHARGDVIAFIDADAYPREDWLRNAVRHFAEPDVAAVGGPSSTPPSDNDRQQAGERVLSSWLVGGVHNHRTVPKTLRDVDDLPSCNLLVRRSALEAAGGFDTPYWPGEDTVLCWRLTHQLGHRIVYDPDVQVWHHRRPLFREHWRQIGNYALHRGYFVKRFPASSCRPSYFLPTLWLLFLLVGWLPLLRVPAAWPLYAAPCVFYVLWILLTILKVFSIKGMCLMAAGIVTTHVVYGIHFVRGLLARRLPEESI